MTRRKKKPKISYLGPAVLKAYPPLHKLAFTGEKEHGSTYYCVRFVKHGTGPVLLDIREQLVFSPTERQPKAKTFFTRHGFSLQTPDTLDALITLLQKASGEWHGLVAGSGS
jgi:hypothetical protein